MEASELFSPLDIGSITVRNRIVQPAHSKLYSEHGVDTRRDRDYYVARAEGGTALLITGERLVHPTSPVGRPRFTSSYLRSSIENDRRITEAVHAAGAKILAQLNHVGVEGSSDSVDDLRFLVGPSQVPSPLFSEVPKALTRMDIDNLLSHWAQSAEHSREGGFDGIELHLAHGYLLAQFLSPLYNQRSDEYGGSLANRLRLAREVITAVRERVGRDYVVGVRLGLTEFAEGGIEVREAVEAARLLADDGQIDFINTSGGGYHSGQHRLIAPSDTEDGWLLGRVARLKAAVGEVPVFAVGAIREPKMAASVVAAGTADMVGLTRALIADPEWPNKVRERRDGEIYRCIKGNQGCISRVWRGLPMACTVNPAAGREGVLPNPRLEPASENKLWIVVGAGPAGLKAAETLARREQGVMVLEREAMIGGQINLLTRAPGRAGFAVLVEDLEHQLERLGVAVELETEATPELLRERSPDGVVLANGSRPERNGFSAARPENSRLVGVELPHVKTSWEALVDPRLAGPRVVVLDELGNREVAGVAEALLDAGRDVELVSRWSSLFPFTAASLDEPILYERMLGKGLRYRLNAWAEAITPGGVHISNLYTGEDTDLPEVDTVVLGTGRRADTALAKSLAEEEFDVISVGDCLAPRSLDHAVYEGYLAGLELAPEERYIAEGTLESWG